jgi:spore maturation protein CgeB
MLILYVALKYDYGKSEQGYSFEHYNFHHTLEQMGHDILYFDFKTLEQENGRDWINRRLFEIVQTETPDLMFTVLALEDVLEPAVVRQISEHSNTITLNWFCDDHYRFDDYSRFWAPCFNWAVTTAKSALPQYANLGYHNVIRSQWACNHFLYRKLDLPPIYDVTFVGQPHSNRLEIVQALRHAGIDVRAWGNGWESGRLSQQDLIRVFNQSRININLANASCPSMSSKPKVQKRGETRGWLSRSFDFILGGTHLQKAGKKCVSRLRLPEFMREYSINSNDDTMLYKQQIKGRNFEVPGCGGFLLTEQVEDLESYYEIGKEVVCFKDIDDLVEKIRYYLHHETERTLIAQAGYQRTLREHTYVHRFNEIFTELGLL